jgi:hypothetical protein
MRIREYTPADLDALRRMHASQGFDYAFPDLSDPIFISKLILEDDSGRPVMASLARLTCEMYLLIDRAAPSDSADRAADAPNACHSERSPALLSSRGVRAARDSVEESLLHADPSNAPTPASCGVRELAPAVCRPGSPGSAPRINSQSAPSQASENNSDEPRSRSREGNARAHWEQLLALHRAGEQDLLARGLDDAHAWLPPQIARRFGRRLESLGWLRDDSWTPYCRRLVP